MKTMRISEIKNYVNSILEDSKISQESKKEFCVFLENILHSTKNYNGFNFIEWVNGGCDKWREDGRPSDNSKYIGKEYNRIYY